MEINNFNELFFKIGEKYSLNSIDKNSDGNLSKEEVLLAAYKDEELRAELSEEDLELISDLIQIEKDVSTTEISSVNVVSDISKTEYVQKGTVTKSTENWTIEDYCNAAIEKLSNLSSLASKTMSDECYTFAVKEASNHKLEYLDLDEDGKITYKDLIGLMCAANKFAVDSNYYERLQEYSDTLSEETRKIEKKCLENLNSIKENKDYKDKEKEKYYKYEVAQEILEKSDLKDNLTKSMLGNDYWINKMYSNCIGMAITEANSNIYDLDEVTSFQNLFDSLEDGDVSDSRYKFLQNASNKILNKLNITKIVSDSNWEEKLNSIEGISKDMRNAIYSAAEYAKNNPEMAKYAGLYEALQSNKCANMSTYLSFSYLDINNDGVVNFSDLNSLPDEIDFDCDGTISDKEISVLKNIKHSLYSQLIKKLQNNSGPREDMIIESVPKSNGDWVENFGLFELSLDTGSGINSMTSCNSNWNINDLIGMVQYASKFKSCFSSYVSQENRIIDGIIKSLDYALPYDIDLQGIVDAIANCDNDSVKEHLAKLKDKAMEIIEKNNNQQIVSGEFKEVVDANGLQIITANSSKNAELIKQENSSLSVNNYKLDPYDISTYDFYMRLTGQCSKAIKMNGYGAWVEIIDGKLMYSFNFDDEKEEYQYAKQFFIKTFGKDFFYFDDENHIISIKQNVTMEELSEKSGTPIIYGPEAGVEIMSRGSTLKTQHEIGASVPQIYYLYNGNVIFSTVTSQSYLQTNAGAFPVYKNVSIESLKEIADFYVKKLT